MSLWERHVLPVNEVKVTHQDSLQPGHCACKGTHPSLKENNAALAWSSYGQQSAYKGHQISDAKNDRLSNI